METLSIRFKNIIFPGLISLLIQTISASAADQEESNEWIKKQIDSVQEIESTDGVSNDPPKLPDQSKQTILNHIFDKPSPVEKFRHLLNVNPSELESELDTFPKETRSRINAKISEYRELSVEQRHQKLMATELRWYLPPLLNIDQETRDLHLKKLDPGLANVILQRLKTWDSLPDELKSSSLKSGLIIGHLSKAPLQNPPLPNTARTEVVTSVTAHSAPKLPSTSEDGKSVDKAIPVSQERLQRLQAYFEMSQEAKNATLKDASVMNDPIFISRLNWLENMPEVLRERVLSHLIRFQDLSNKEKKAFGQSIKTWNRLPKSEKQALRNLVKRTPPFPGKSAQLD